jgi:hypothetical protein
MSTDAETLAISEQLDPARMQELLDNQEQLLQEQPTAD